MDLTIVNCFYSDNFIYLYTSKENLFSLLRQMDN